MRIEVLTQAKEDLFDGFQFHERQEAGGRFSSNGSGLDFTVASTRTSMATES